ncbi:hypothetical protein IscW_ISCW011809 [Ixodes scapularis]|uniref:Uncharacterized protein n=1 Tax=Ixodes scapularis TaxID=6945 RepID=B7Q8M9_IXOSC|nr:hypothetical protein IscW_ISCW011809 [Ixodes scapularis]|eukprot:XP_002412383.1 hypothetical protein IscW_ISCW011809 [Ixodes scapularis]
MASLENCFDAMQSKEPVRVQSICSVVLLWVQLGETIAQDFDPAIWKSPTLRNINDLNDSLLRIWKVAMDRTSELVYKVRQVCLDVVDYSLIELLVYKEQKNF